MASNDLISIIVPVYKVEQYLPKCVDSILAQTYTNFELLLVDDGSPDNCGKICDEYAEKDTRIRVIHKKNGGPSSARNQGIDCAIGEYVVFVDSDDTIMETYLENLYTRIAETKTDICFEGITGKCRDIDPKGVLLFGENLTQEKEQFLLQFIKLCSGITGHVYRKIYRREIIGDIRFREDLFWGEDLTWVASVAFHAKSFSWVDGNLYCYRENAQSITNTYKKNMLRNQLGFYHAIQEIYASVDENIKTKALRELFAIMVHQLFREEWLYRKENAARYRGNLKNIRSSVLYQYYTFKNIIHIPLLKQRMTCFALMMAVKLHLI